MRGFIVLLVIIAAPAIALATRIVFRDVALPAAMDQSEIAVIATFMEGTTPHRFEVTERLSAEGPVSGMIDVVRVESEMMARAIAAYHQTGVRRSPLVRRLETGADLVAGRSYCLLLQPRSAHFRLAVARSHVAAPCPRIRARFTRERQTAE